MKNLISFFKNPKTIDNDIVMDKILAKPQIAIDILINIYNNMKASNMIDDLKNTKLGNYFSSNPQIFH